MKQALPLVFILILSIFFMPACFKKQASSCVSCHTGIEHFSDNHTAITCAGCHSGDETQSDKDKAHIGMLGGKNPSSPKVWEKTCGECHEYQVKRVASSLMTTNTGIIKNTLEAWGEDNTKLFATDNVSGHSAAGTQLNMESLLNSDNIVVDMYRKFCTGCHVNSDGDVGYMSMHSSGCAACHMPYGEFGEYAGKDAQMIGKSPYSTTHTLTALPNDDVCMRCHNRSGRISLSYMGLYDGNNALTPTKDGVPGPIIFTDARTLRHMAADIHYTRGMECIDCHTSMETMGDGYYYDNMYKQLEISCENCHGAPEKLPETVIADRENSSAMNDNKNYKQSQAFGKEYVLTDKKRTYSNVYKENGKYYLKSKRSGKVRDVKTITGTNEHSLKGHEKLECFTCHSQSVIQCYGCHVSYDETKTMLDLEKKVETKGLFSETEDIRTFFPFPLAVNQRGKISPVTPGCQTFLTHIDENGTVIRNEFVPNFRGRKKLKFAPFFGHSTGEKAVSCENCHSDPFFYGFGNGLFAEGSKTFTSAMTCDECDEPLNAMDFIDNGTLNRTSDIVRENSRLLTVKEITNMIEANKCIVCHDSASNGYYKGNIDYDKILRDKTHSPLLR